MINSTATLKDAILTLEHSQRVQGKLLKEQFDITLDGLKPINLIKNIFREAVSAPGLPTRMLSATVGLGAGYLSKKIVVGRTHNPIKNILGALLQYGVAGLVAKNPDAIKSSGLRLLKSILPKKKLQSDFHQRKIYSHE